jgi:hypothetical protein
MGRLKLGKIGTVMDGEGVPPSQEEGLSRCKRSAINVGGRVVEIFFPIGR